MLNINKPVYYVYASNIGHLFPGEHEGRPCYVVPTTR